MQMNGIKKTLSFVLRRIVFNPEVISASIMLSYFLLSLLGMQQNISSEELMAQYPVQVIMSFFYVAFYLYAISFFYFIEAFIRIAIEIEPYWRAKQYKPLVSKFVALLNAVFLYFLPFLFVRHIYVMPGVFEKFLFLVLSLIAMHASFCHMKASFKKEEALCNA